MRVITDYEENNPDNTREDKQFSETVRRPAKMVLICNHPNKFKTITRTHKQRLSYTLITADNFRLIPRVF